MYEAEIETRQQIEAQLTEEAGRAALCGTSGYCMVVLHDGNASNCTVRLPLFNVIVLVQVGFHRRRLRIRNI